MECCLLLSEIDQSGTALFCSVGMDLRKPVVTPCDGIDNRGDTASLFRRLRYLEERSVLVPRTSSAGHFRGENL